MKGEKPSDGFPSHSETSESWQRPCSSRDGPPPPAFLLYPPSHPLQFLHLLLPLGLSHWALLLSGPLISQECCPSRLSCRPGVFFPTRHPWSLSLYFLHFIAQWDRPSWSHCLKLVPTLHGSASLHSTHYHLANNSLYNIHLTFPHKKYMTLKGKKYCLLCFGIYRSFYPNSSFGPGAWSLCLPTPNP